ncbi:hypothetical protein [Actinomadura hallensis]|nr:hypothetical protein [Actinomadura hallensis]
MQVGDHLRRAALGRTTRGSRSCGRVRNERAVSSATGSVSRIP